MNNLVLVKIPHVTKSKYSEEHLRNKFFLQKRVNKIQI